MPVDPASGIVAVIARVDGTPVRMVLDTGAQTTILTTDAIRRLGLSQDFQHATLMRGASGTVVTGESRPVTLVFAGVGARDMRLRVAPFPLPPLGGAPLDGLLGGDFLATMDLDLDLPHGRVVLYRTRPCPGAAPPWAEPFVAVPMLPSPNSRIVFPVAVNGVEMGAVLDTGATLSTLSRAGALRAGITEAEQEHGQAVTSHAAGTALFVAHAARVRSIRIGTETFPPSRLLVGDLQLGNADLLLGLDYLRTRRVFVSYATRTVFIARRGTE